MKIKCLTHQGHCWKIPVSALVIATLWIVNLNITDDEDAIRIKDQ